MKIRLISFLLSSSVQIFHYIILEILSNINGLYNRVIGLSQEFSLNMKNKIIWPTQWIYGISFSKNSKMGHLVNLLCRNLAFDTHRLLPFYFLKNLVSICKFSRPKSIGSVNIQKYYQNFVKIWWKLQKLSESYFWIFLKN